MPPLITITKTLSAPSITNTCHNLTQYQADNWTTPYIQYLQTGNPPPNADRTWITKAARYTMIGDDLYKRGTANHFTNASRQNKLST